MLFELIQSTDDTYEGLPDTAVMTGFWFDYKRNAYVIDAGTPEEVTGVEAVKAWLELVVRTARGRYAIYPSNFGARAQDLIGKKIPSPPKGLNLSELRRHLVESSRYLPAIQEISRMTYDGEKIHCTVILDTEAGRTQEVIDIEP